MSPNLISGNCFRPPSALPSCLRPRSAGVTPKPKPPASLSPTVAVTSVQPQPDSGALRQTLRARLFSEAGRSLQQHYAIGAVPVFSRAASNCLPPQPGSPQPGSPHRTALHCTAAPWVSFRTGSSDHCGHCSAAFGERCPLFGVLWLRILRRVCHRRSDIITAAVGRPPVCLFQVDPHPSPALRAHANHTNATGAHIS